MELFRKFQRRICIKETMGGRQDNSHCFLFLNYLPTAKIHFLPVTHELYWICSWNFTGRFSLWDFVSRITTLAVLYFELSALGKIFVRTITSEPYGIYSWVYLIETVCGKQERQLSLFQFLISLPLAKICETYGIYSQKILGGCILSKQCFVNKKVSSLCFSLFIYLTLVWIHGLAITHKPYGLFIPENSQDVFFIETMSCKFLLL